MGENTFRVRPITLGNHPPSPRLQAAGAGFLAGEPAAIYWRRRLVVLVIGLTVFALAVTGLSGVLKVSPAPAPGHSRGSGASHARQGSAGLGPHGAAGTIPQTSRSPGRSSQSAAASPSQTSSSAARSSPDPSASGAGHAPGGFRPAFCARHAIVLSVTVSQAAFGRRAVPRFSLSIVSTQMRTCSFNVGSAHLALVVQDGVARIWSSADCARGSGSQVATLKRGVPAVVTVTWRRRTSSPRCATRGRAVPPGVYTAYAVDAALVSAPVTFRLR